MKDKEAALRGQGVAGGTAGKLARESLQGDKQSQQTKAQKRSRCVCGRPCACGCYICSSWMLLTSVTVSICCRLLCKSKRPTPGVKYLNKPHTSESGMRNKTQTTVRSSSHPGCTLVVPSHAGLSSRRYPSGRRTWQSVRVLASIRSKARLATSAGSESAKPCCTVCAVWNLMPEPTLKPCKISPAGMGHSLEESAVALLLASVHSIIL